MRPLSLTNKRWLISDDIPVPKDKLVSFLLRQRNLRPITEIGKMQEPAVFPDIHKAADRINLAIKNNHKIAVFGDYDCDGITAAAQLIRFFRRREVDPFCRLPHRIHDGYGLNKSVIDELIGQKIDLLITVDTGIASKDEIAYAKKSGIDVIVTDHHHVPEKLPDCAAILHPALSPDFTGPHLSGSGVALALVRALEKNEWDDMENDICLAMFGTVADLVEIKGDNRVLVYYGLKALSQMTEGPLAYLKTLCGLENRECTSEDVGFRIAPRINAAGRLDDPRLALKGLLGDTDALFKLDAINKQRQEQTKELYKQAVFQLNLTDDPLSADGQYLLCSASENYHPGIIGLIAGKLTDKYGKPSMAVYLDNNECTASLRSPPAYHITEGLIKIENLLETYGGHAQAAGCSFKKNNLDDVAVGLSQDIKENTAKEDLLPAVMIDAVIDPRNVSLELIKQLDQLKPYGVGNEVPNFLLKNVTLSDLRIVGKDNSHLQCQIDGIKGIGFGLGHLIDRLKEPVDIVCQLEKDSWNGNERAQMVMRDIKHLRS